MRICQRIAVTRQTHRFVLNQVKLSLFLRSNMRLLTTNTFLIGYVYQVLNDRFQMDFFLHVLQHGTDDCESNGNIMLLNCKTQRRLSIFVQNEHKIMKTYAKRRLSIIIRYFDWP